MPLLLHYTVHGCLGLHNVIVSDSELADGGQGQVYGRSNMVSTLLTLGTPHLSLEQYPFGRVPVCPSQSFSRLK